MDWAAEGLLDNCADERAREARRALLDKLHADGVPLEELRRAVAEERLALLPVDRLLTSEARYTAREIAEQSGLDLDFFQDQRRALGLAVPGPDERVYGERDLDAARMGNQYRQAGLPDEEAMEAQRVLGRGMARYVEAITALVGQSVLEGGIDEHELAARLEAVSKMLLPLAGPWLEHVFALHLREALRQDVVTAEQMATGRMDSGRDYAVAFADLVGFTELGETIPVEELGSVAGRLSKLAEAAVEPPVKIVKEIGDAVMLVSPEPAALVDAALRARGRLRRRGAARDPRRHRLRAGRQPLGRLVRLDGQRRQPPDHPRAAVVGAGHRGGEGRRRTAYEWSYAGEKKLKGLAAPLRTYRARRPG